jgi:single-stranded-DNA-specific exonuclease
MQAKWIEPAPCDAVASRRIATGLGMPPALAEVMARRGLETGEDGALFLDPKLGALTAPERIGGVPEAVEVLDSALRLKRRIVLYGDYDVDGVASLALLSRVLAALGGSPACFLPLRADEGYGLGAAGVERCCREHDPEVLIAVDCGTNSVREIAGLVDRGIRVVVLDHHEPTSGPPAGAVVVNPKLDGGPWDYLCGAGVVFKVVHALLKHSPHPSLDLREYLDLVAVATVADMVPLVAENRILVRHGLAQLTRSRWPGLRALMESASVHGTPRGSDIGFRIGPRINASGRLGTALDSLRLLLTDDPLEAGRIATRLELQNRQRQAVERSVSGQAEQWINQNHDPARHASIVAGARDWHQGVLGIVAARMMRRHHRPTLVVGFDGNGLGRGSGRSVEGFSLVDALERCAGLLEAYGGHELAAGLSIREDRFEEFRAAFERVARQSASDESLFVPRLHLDAELTLGAIDDRFLDAQDRMEPFGSGNSQPVFFARGLTPSGTPRILKEKHYRFEFSGRRHALPAIYFNGAELPLPRPPWDLAFRVERNTYQGRDEPQIHVVSIRSAA